MKRVYSIQEYGCLVAERQVEGWTTLPAVTFAKLENFLLAARGGVDPLELMGVSARRGVGRVLTARNYVGVIATADGAVIEILPKICSATPEGDPRARARRLLIEMLSELPDAPYRALQTTGVDTARMNLLEAFVRMFIDEVFAIVRRGLRCDYVRVEEDARYLRGKLDLPRHILENAAHRERFAIICDRYTTDRPENRLLKSTLLFLRRHSGSPQNLRDLRLLLDAFAAVPPSVDVIGDLRRCAPDRNTRDYTWALLWCRVFLAGRGFTSFAGDDVALALLFPMEALFERYVARRLRRKLGGKGFSVSIQDGSRRLFDAPPRFRLRPDIVVRREADGAVFVLDTKWKLLRANAKNGGVAEADMYQMYAYQRRFGAANATLVYPWTEEAPPESERCFSASDGARVQLQFFDLLQPEGSLSEMVESLAQCSLIS